MPVNVQQLRRTTKRLAARAVGEDFKQPKSTVADMSASGSIIADFLNGPTNASEWTPQYVTDASSPEYGLPIDPPGY